MFWIKATENGINPAGFFKILDFHRFLEVLACYRPWSAVGSCGVFGKGLDYSGQGLLAVAFADDMV